MRMTSHELAAFAHARLSPVLVSVQQNACYALNLADSQRVRSFFSPLPFLVDFSKMLVKKKQCAGVSPGVGKFQQLAEGI